jgi:hypothetical protein
MLCTQKIYFTEAASFIFAHISLKQTSSHDWGREKIVEQPEAPKADKLSVFRYRVHLPAESNPISRQQFQTAPRTHKKWVCTTTYLRYVYLTEQSCTYLFTCRYTY